MNKCQLPDETDYLREGSELRRFGTLLAGDARYIVPELEDGLTTRHVLAMTFVEGQSIETLTDAPQAVRDAAMTALIDVVLHELFAFGAVEGACQGAPTRYRGTSTPPAI